MIEKRYSKYPQHALTVQLTYSLLPIKHYKSFRSSEGSCPTLQARRSKKRHVLRYPSSGPVPARNADPCRKATAKNLSKGLRPLAPSRGFPSLPHCAALRLCRPRGFPLSLRSVASPGRFPSPCTCYPRRRGPGPRRCCVNNNSKAIQEQRQRRNTNEQRSHYHRKHCQAVN